MATLAAHWVERVFPRVPVRQWVLTVPWSRRWALARRPELVRRFTGLALRRVSGFLAEQARQQGIEGGRTGSVSVVQRFGSALNLNVHVHALVLDGVYARGDDGELRFHRLPPPTTEEVERLVEGLAVAAEGMFLRAGCATASEAEDEEEGLSLVQAASVAGWSAVRGRKAKRVQVLGGRAFRLPPRCATCAGYTVHAGTAVGARDRGGLERLCRYVARPAVSSRRVTELADGRVRLELKRPWSDGTVALTFTAEELVERLASLVPPPRAHQVLYHGVLAGRSAWRREVVPEAPEQEEEPETDALSASPRRGRTRYRTWAWLLWRVFGEAGWRCPRCGGRMVLRAVPWAPATVRILDGLRRSARGPP
jgi:hypothetical protein